MNRKQFEAPEMTVQCFEVEDVIMTLSGMLNDGGAGDNLDSGDFSELFG